MSIETRVKALEVMINPGEDLPEYVLIKRESQRAGECEDKLITELMAGGITYPRVLCETYLTYLDRIITKVKEQFPHNSIPVLIANGNMEV